YDELSRLCPEIADKYRWAFVNVNFRPYYSEGSKTYGYEIVEQLGWRTPDHVVVPCAGGSLITKIWKAMKEFKQLGLIERVGTKVHAAQALGCGPIVTMIKNDTDVLVPVRPNTIAKSLAIGNPADGYYAYRTVKESGGYGEHATDAEIIDGMLLLARTEGIFTETAGGVTIAATKKLIDAGVIGKQDSLVVCITGNGLKTPDPLYARLETHVKRRPSGTATRSRSFPPSREGAPGTRAYDADARTADLSTRTDTGTADLPPRERLRHHHQHSSRRREDRLRLGRPRARGGRAEPRKGDRLAQGQGRHRGSDRARRHRPLIPGRDRRRRGPSP